jgi:hypothetical protein
MYKEIFSFSELFYSDKDINEGTVMFFDIQGVILKNNNYHEALVLKKYEEKLKNLCNQHNENYIKISRFGRFFKSTLTETLLLDFLKKLVNLGVELCLLTFARYSTDRERALKNLKVLNYFHRQIWAGGIDKGLLLVEYLKTRPVENPVTNVIFIDDKKEHLASARKTLDEYINDNNLELKYKLCCYQKHPVKPVNEIDFLEFWKNVIISYKKNKIKKQYMKKNATTNKTVIANINSDSEEEII